MVEWESAMAVGMSGRDWRGSMQGRGVWDVRDVISLDAKCWNIMGQKRGGTVMGASKFWGGWKCIMLRDRVMKLTFMYVKKII